MGNSWPMVTENWRIRTPPFGRILVRHFLCGSSQGPQWEWTDWALRSPQWGVNKVRYHGKGFPALLFDSFKAPTFLPWGHFLKQITCTQAWALLLVKFRLRYLWKVLQLKGKVKGKTKQKLYWNSGTRTQFFLFGEYDSLGMSSSVKYKIAKLCD